MNAYDLYTFYIEAKDLKGQNHRVKVESVSIEEVFNPGTKKKEPKIVLHLVGKKKVLSLNKTRAGQMIEITGTPEIEQWTGAEILIKPGKQSGKDTILIEAVPAAQVKPQVQAPRNQPEKVDAPMGTRIQELRAKANVDFLVAFSELKKAAGLDSPTVQEILKECGGDYEKAFDVIARQYAEVIG